VVEHRKLFVLPVPAVRPEVERLYYLRLAAFKMSPMQQRQYSSTTRVVVIYYSFNQAELIG
jgi:hypothetical protein